MAPLLGDVRYGQGAAGAELWLLCFRYSFLHPAHGKKTTVSFLPDPWREGHGYPPLSAGGAPGIDLDR